MFNSIVTSFPTTSPPLSSVALQLMPKSRRSITTAGLDTKMCPALKVALTVYLEGDRYLFGHPMHREHARGHEARAALFNPGTLKGYLRKFRYIEKFGCAQVLVSGLYIGINTLSFDSNFDGRPGDVLLVIAGLIRRSR